MKIASRAGLSAIGYRLSAIFTSVASPSLLIAPVARSVRLLRRLGRADPAPGAVRFGDLRRTTPISRAFGYNRGLPVDRHYIEGFLATHAADIRGRVLEIGDASYTRRFGGARVAQSDVLHVREGNPQASFVGDLATAEHLPSGAFDCAILTQTLHLIYDLRAAVTTIHRILRPGGVVLATVPGISQISADEWTACWYWSLTALSARRLFGAAFGEPNVMVGAHGNVLAAAAFLYGLAAEELRPHELKACDGQYELLITIRAVKAGSCNRGYHSDG